MGRGGGLVLLGGIRKLAAQTVPDLMQKFLATSGNEHTRFELHTESSFTADLLQAVAEERLDMAFVSHPGDDTVFENVAFARSPFVVVTPPNHPLAQKQRHPAGDAALSVCVFFPSAAACAAPSMPCSKNRCSAENRLRDGGRYRRSRYGGGGLWHCHRARPPRSALHGFKDHSTDRPRPGRTAYLCRKRGALQPAAAQRFFAFCQAQLSQGAAL